MSILRRVLGGAGDAPFAPDADFADIARWEREGDSPLAPGAAEAAGAASLRIAVVVPWLIEGSGGHSTILNLVRGLEARGHELSLWVHDPAGRHDGAGDAGATRMVADWFGGMGGAVRIGFDAWTGADVVLATGWQTVHRVLMLEGCRGRSYLVQDHEPDFYPESAERRWADGTYRLGLHCIAAGRWLRDLTAQNYGASASWFELGVDHSVYAPRDAERADDVVAVYSRTTTPRRAVPLALLALAEVRREHPEVKIELFGDPRRAPARFDAHNHGVLPPDALAALYARSTVGVVLSLTNYSLVAQEMLASGLPCVEADTPSTRGAFAGSDAVELAPVTVRGVTNAVLRLLRDGDLREARRQAGLTLVAERTWDRAAQQLENGLREALSR